MNPLFLGDDGHVVSALEDVSLPAGEPIDLVGKLGFHVAHEAGDLVSILDHGEDMQVGGQRGDGTESEVVVSLTPSKDAKDEVVELRSGSEEEASLDGAAGDEDEGSRVGELAKFSGHSL